MKNTQKEITNSNVDLTPYLDLIKQICVELRECPTLVIMVMYVWRFIRQLGGMLLKQEIDRRARQPESWRKCPCCGHINLRVGYRTAKTIDKYTDRGQELSLNISCLVCYIFK